VLNIVSLVSYPLLFFSDLLTVPVYMYVRVACQYQCRTCRRKNSCCQDFGTFSYDETLGISVLIIGIVTSSTLAVARLNESMVYFCNQIVILTSVTYFSIDYKEELWLSCHFPVFSYDVLRNVLIICFEWSI
jgi:hypothetical protein